MKPSVTKTDVQKAVKISRTQPTVSSTDVAKLFGKQHKNVLRDIENMQISLLKIEPSDSKYFKDTSYINSRNKTYKRFDLTREGFDLIVLGFTGDKALQYKVWFIDEFHKKTKTIASHKAIASSNQDNTMWLKLREESKEARLKLTDAIKEYELPQRIEEGKAHEKFLTTRIINYTQLIYKKLGIVLPAGTNPRDVLSPRELIKLEDAEVYVSAQIKALTEDGTHYKQAYQEIKKELLT